MGAVSVAVYTIIATYIILNIIQITIGLRVDGNSEVRGLDLTEHEERGYSGAR
jgi:Amt family ammonium transporter